MVTLILIQTFTQLCFWFQLNEKLKFNGLQIHLTVYGTESVLLSFFKQHVYTDSVYLVLTVFWTFVKSDLKIRFVRFQLFRPPLTIDTLF